MFVLPTSSVVDRLPSSEIHVTRRPTFHSSFNSWTIDVAAYRYAWSVQCIENEVQNSDE